MAVLLAKHLTDPRTGFKSYKLDNRLPASVWPATALATLLLRMKIDERRDA